jgi:collagenase-like PrtC family protease
MAVGIAYAHEHGVKVYVAANILAHNGDVEESVSYFRELRDMQPEAPDGVIIADPGMLRVLRSVWPEAEVHLSTQANNTNYQTYLFWYEQGVKRVVSARELSLAEISEIRAKIPEDMEIESFVHGSMCISYSGRCLLSNFLTSHDSNRGACTHPCRWRYSVVEETRPGEVMPVFENERGTFLFHSRDLCMIGHIPELIDAGIDSFKIEGRMKNALYVAAVTGAYRKAIDDYVINEDCYRANLPQYKEELGKCTYRPYSTGFYFGRPGSDEQIYHEDAYITDYKYMGIIGEVKPQKEIPMLSHICLRNDIYCINLVNNVSTAERHIEPHDGINSDRSTDTDWDTNVDCCTNADCDTNVDCGTYSDRGTNDNGTNNNGTNDNGTNDNDTNADCGTSEAAENDCEISFCHIEQKNKFSVGDEIEIVKPSCISTLTKVTGIFTEEGIWQPSAPHARQKLWVSFTQTPEEGDLLRRKSIDQ